MSLLGMVNKFKHKGEIRESKDEILIGELIYLFSLQGHAVRHGRGEEPPGRPLYGVSSGRGGRSGRIPLLRGVTARLS